MRLHSDKKNTSLTYIYLTFFNSEIDLPKKSQEKCIFDSDTVHLHYLGQL